VVTDAVGNVKARHDYLPFGEEIFAGVGGRTTGQGYSQLDGTRQKFAGSERDTETNLDFMQTRYYSSAMGRFTSPDEPFADQEAYDPQSWNLYSYVRNNPLRFIDPFGLARHDANGNWVGDEDGEYDESLKAHWRVDSNRELGGYWDFGGDQSPVQATYTLTFWDKMWSTLELMGTGRIAAANDEHYARLAATEEANRVLNDPGVQFAMNTVGIAPLYNTIRASAAAASSKAGFTKAGHSLTKHGLGKRPGNALFSAPKGNSSQINKQAQDIIDDILSNPGTTATKGYRPRFGGEVIEVSAPDGRGLVLDTKGNFLFFKEN